MQLSNVQLEVSLKPFKALSEEGLRAVCRTLFEQWLPLCRTSRQVSVLLWAADGSEILDYQGDLSAEFEWAKWVGVANPRAEKPKGPKGEAVHHSPRLYIEQPPSWTYGDLKRLIGLLKEVGAEVTGLPVRVGATFDPGPEFAVSSFKYERHPELCPGETMGKGSFAVCYATLHGDNHKYATFPEGIPEGTPFGTFLGRQARCFMEELGYDYLWLSNGFGFGLEPWGLRGAVFNGKKFFPERAEAVKEGSLAFWKALRDELGDLPLATRGTNLSTGMDLASDGVPLRELYAGGFNFEPPPNSPWAALNGDFGLELIGWMSHIAELPGRDYPFRFYIHDPWFLNSPWLDRYGRQPHDIYLPLAVSRIDAAGEVSTPNSQLLLTVDDSHGELPDQVPQEVLPHLLDAWRTAPDEPGPLVWVYPFAEYHEWTFGSPDRIEEVFFGDWFMRGAVNAGLPLNTVISTTSLPSALGRLAESLLVSPVPDAGSAWEEALLGHVIRGGKALLYGPLGHAGPELLEALRVDLTAPLEGDFELALACEQDLTETTPFPTRLAHSAFLSGGGLEAEPREGAAPPFAASTQDGAQRVAATLAQVGEGTLAWVRGTVACDPERTTGHLLVPLEAEQLLPRRDIDAVCAGPAWDSTVR